MIWCLKPNIKLPVWLKAWCDGCFPCSKPPKSGQSANSQTPRESLIYNKCKVSGQTKPCRLTLKKKIIINVGLGPTWDARTGSVLSSCWTAPSLAGKWWDHSLSRTRTSVPEPAGLNTAAAHRLCVKRKCVKCRKENVFLKKHKHDRVCTGVFWGIWWWRTGPLGQGSCSPGAPRRGWQEDQANISVNSPSYKNDHSRKDQN